MKSYKIFYEIFPRANLSENFLKIRKSCHITELRSVCGGFTHSKFAWNIEALSLSHFFLVSFV